MLWRSVVRIVMACAMAGGALAVDYSPASASDDGLHYPREQYCNVLEPTPACTNQLTAPSAPALDDLLPHGRSDFSCSVPEASFSSGGGFLVQEVQGHGYILCTGTSAALAISGVLTGDPAGGEIETEHGDIPFAYGDDAFGQWACGDAFICLMSTQKARGYGTQTCWTLQNHGTSSSPAATASKTARKCYRF